MGVWEKLRSLTWTRNKSGDNLYTLNRASAGWGDYDSMSNLKIAQNHPILTPAMLFVSNLFAQAEFKVVNKDTGKERKNHWLTKLLNSPNLYQTQIDFLESLQFMRIAQGQAIVWAKRPVGFEDSEDIESLYILDADKIKWPENYKSTMFTSQNGLPSELKSMKIKYDESGENLDIKVSQLLFFYDLPNCLRPNFFEATSRISGLRQTLLNTHDSLVAKNIILKTNGQYILGTGGNEHFPLAGEDKKQAENLLQNDYGLGWNRKRGIITKANVTYQTMHIALRDLGLDESVKVDGNIVFTALHIPKDIISLEAKKTTYNNFKESMVSYVQNEMQSNLNSMIAVLQKLLGDSNLKIVGSYEHLPIMQYILIERYEGISKKAKALNDLLITGIPKEVALEMCGFDKNLKLEEIQVITNSVNTNIDGNEDQAEDGTQGDGEDKEQAFKIA